MGVAIWIEQEQGYKGAAPFLLQNNLVLVLIRLYDQGSWMLLSREQKTQEDLATKEQQPRCL